MSRFDACRRQSVGLSSLLFVLAISLLPTAESLKHSFRTKNDDRTLIGPLGAPFGFTEKGHFNFTVSNFELSLSADEDLSELEDVEENRRKLGILFGKKDKKIEVNEDLANAIRNRITGIGFILKRFRDEAAFQRFMKHLRANPSKCAFQDSVENFEASNGMDDDVAGGKYGGKDVHGDPTAEGIFLNMIDTNRWAPNTVSVNYDFDEDEQGLYFLIFQICTAGGDSMRIYTDFDLDFHFSNTDVLGSISYLSAGEMALPHVFFYFSILYAICLFLWFSNIHLVGNGQPGHFDDGTVASAQGQGQKPVVYPIHYMMGVLLALKFFALLFESLRYHFLRVTGSATFWSGLYYLFIFLKGAFLFTIILLLGSGWSFAKPFLTDREKNIGFVVLALQVINNVALVVLNQFSPGERRFDRWEAISHMVDVICCCAVLIPIVWQVNTLEKNVEQSVGYKDSEKGKPEVTIEAPEEDFEDIPANADRRLAAKLRQFRDFYLLVVAYIYSTRIISYLFAKVLSYRFTWLSDFVVEIVTLAFFVTVGMQFRPMVENPYLQLKSYKSARPAAKAVETKMKKTQD